MTCPCKTGKHDMAVRPSCLECVEKHLGAAMVLIGEVLNGYPHRLLAIGHLHEAEEESFDWPALRSLIRQARRRYQNHNAAPDWEAFSREIARVAPERHGRVVDLLPDYAI
jgi:hypothetical protein